MRNQKYEAFLEAARTGSFKQAASELGYTQAGVSYLANALEKELGVRLFVREHGGVRLTSEGAALLPWIQEVCASERRLEAHLADLKQLEEGSLHIVAFTSTLTQWLPQITKRFTEAHPHIDLRITCCDDQAQLEHIVESGQAERRNRARRRRALRGPSSSARKTGSAKPTKANPKRCCFRGIKKRGRGNPDLVSLAPRSTS